LAAASTWLQERNLHKSTGQKSYQKELLGVFTYNGGQDNSFGKLIIKFENSIEKV